MIQIEHADIRVDDNQDIENIWFKDCQIAVKPGKALRLRGCGLEFNRLNGCEIVTLRVDGGGSLQIVKIAIDDDGYATIRGVETPKDCP